jgi:hypothetical protein
MKKQKPSVSKKSDNAKLADGAAKIRKAQKEKEANNRAAKPEQKNGKGKKAKKVTAPPPEPVVIPESTRPIQDILKDRVTVLPGSIGIKLADATPIEESLRVLDWATTMSNHVGFMIGDILAFGSAKWGEKYKAALNQTGRAYSTLKGYLETARKIPAANRVAALTFSHHREILRIGDEEKIATVLKEVGAQAEKGHAPSTREVREKVKKLKPKKSKKAKSIGADTKSKKKKSKPEPPPYEPTSEQQSILDELEQNLGVINDTIKSTVVVLPNIHGEDSNSKLLHLLCALDNKEKQRWLKLLEPVFYLYNTVERLTGY